MNFLLNKEYQHRMAILNHLELTPLQTTSIQEVCDSLSLSSFIVKKSIKQIIEDLNEHHITGIQIKLDSKKISLNSDGTDSILTLQRIYLKDSNLFLLLDGIFKEKEFSLEQFSANQYLSLSAAYLLRNELEVILNKYSISIDSDLQLSGLESDIRLFLFEVYFHSFNSLEYPFSKELVELSRLFIKEISNFLGIVFSSTQEIKITFFLCILFQRLFFGNILKKQEQSIQFKDIQLAIKPMVINFFLDTTTLTQAQIKLETSFLCSFLFAGNLIPKISTNASLKFIESSCKPALDLTKLFLKQLNKQFDIQTEATYYPLLRKELNRIHYKFLKFNHSDLMIYFQANPEFLKENYPDFFLFSESFIQTNFKPTEETTILFYDYLFSLIRFLPATLLNNPIYVCVDFSHGKSYNHFISTSIKSFKFLNILIEPSLSNKTNLYLSDFKPTQAHCDYIIWKNPPLPTDWEYFGNKIIELKHQER